MQSVGEIRPAVALQHNIMSLLVDNSVSEVRHVLLCVQAIQKRLIDTVLMPYIDTSGSDDIHGSNSRADANAGTGRGISSRSLSRLKGLSLSHCSGEYHLESAEWRNSEGINLCSFYFYFYRGDERIIRQGDISIDFRIVTHQLYFTQTCLLGVLIHGPSSCGKTSLACWLAQEGRKHFKLISVACADLVHKVSDLIFLH